MGSSIRVSWLSLQHIDDGSGQLVEHGKQLGRRLVGALKLNQPGGLFIERDTGSLLPYPLGLCQELL